MRLPRLRFTVRRLMVAVALAGLVMGGGVWSYRMWRLSRYYSGLAQAYNTGENMYRQIGAMNFDLAQVDEKRSLQLWSPQFGAKLHKALREREEKPTERHGRSAAGAHDVLAQPKRTADYFAAVARKYERAARFPWLPVEPDPPLP